MTVIRYLVNDVDEALPFYKALGFRLADRWGPPFAVMKGHRTTLWLSGPGTSAQKPLKDGRKPEPGGWNRVVIEVADIHAVVEKLKGLKVKFRSMPIKGPGGQQMLVEDPSGNPLEIFQPRDADVA
jgi:catechol 2,3-dioxygenase-like lactoylglutathione lyase family enzyme